MGQVYFFCFTVILQITLLCGKGQNDTMASPTPYSTFTCFDEILTEVQGNGEAIQEIIDVVASGWGGSIGGGSEEESGVIQTPNYPDFYPSSSYEVIKAYKNWHNHNPFTIAL